MRSGSVHAGLSFAEPGGTGAGPELAGQGVLSDLIAVTRWAPR